MSLSSYCAARMPCGVIFTTQIPRQCLAATVRRAVFPGTTHCRCTRDPWRATPSICTNLSFSEATGERVPESRAPVGSGGTFSLNANIGTHLAEGCFASPSELIYEPRRLQVYRAPYAFTSGEGFRARLLQAQQAPTNAANGTSLDYVERLGRKVRMH